MAFWSSFFFIEKMDVFDAILKLIHIGIFLNYFLFSTHLALCKDQKKKNDVYLALLH